MRILFVHNFHQKHGGDDTVVENYIAMLRRRGHAVDLYQRHNDEILDYGVLDKVRFFVDTIYSIRTRRELKKMICGFRPDLVFVHGIYPLISPSAYDAIKRSGVPLVQMMHDMRPWCANAWFYRDGQVCTLCKNGNVLHGIRYRCYRDSRLMSALYGVSILLSRLRGFFKKTDLFIIPGEHIRQYLLECGVPLERIAYHPHIVAELESGSPTGGAPQSYVAFLGRLSPEKGLRMVVRAAKRFPEMPFRIAGVGPMETELRDAAKELPNLELMGFLSGASKAQFLRDAGLLVAPSECYESFGQVVVEAYMAGTPVLAANHGGLASLVVDGQTGWLFEPANERHFQETLHDVWSDSAGLRAAGKAASRYFECHLSEEVLISRLEHSLESVVKT